MATAKCFDCGKPLTTKPRFVTNPTPRARTWQQPILDAAERLGTPMMPWQRGATRVLAELRADGLPRFKTVGVSVPRQSGKTTLSKSVITAKAESSGSLDLYGTAQSRQYAAKHVVNLGETLGANSVRTLRGVGAESVTWPNGSVYAPISPSDGGGHGDSIDYMLVDEAWALTSVVLGGVRPAMIARPLSQLLLISTMGTADSTAWNGFVTQGREASTDPDATMAWIEYSAPDDEAVFDESRWHEWMPALGITISHEDIRSAMKDLEAAEGRAEVIRAFGNRTTRTRVTVFPVDWVERAWRVIDPPDQFVLAVDVNDAPVGASIATGHLYDEDDTDGVAVRVTEWQYGSPHWVPARVADMIANRSVEAVVGDFGGPAKQIEAEIRSICDEAMVPVVARQPREIAADTSRFYNGMRDGSLALERSEVLGEAIDGAGRKPHGDMWLVARSRMAVDASPLISAILAQGLAVELSVVPKVESRPLVVLPD